MSKRTSKYRRNRQPRCSGYPIQAIKDFFEQLLCEVRISHYETHLAKPEVKPELVSKLDPFTRKYRAVLLPWIDLDDSNLTHEERKVVVAKINEELRRVRDDQLLHLEAIRPLVHEALGRASRPPELHIFHVAKSDGG